MFNISARVNGGLFVTVTYFAQALASGSADCFIKMRVLHVDTGASETVIGTQQTSDTIVEEADTTTEWKRTTFEFDVDKFFQKAEILRIEILPIRSLLSQT